MQGSLRIYRQPLLRDPILALLPIQGSRGKSLPSNHRYALRARRVMHVLQSILRLVSL